MSGHRSDSELLKASRRDPDAFCIFYRRHAEGIYRFFRRRVDEPETASDLTAETFAEVFRGVKRFRGDGDGSAVAWLYGIARNLLRQYHRRNAVVISARRKLGVPVRGDTLVEYDEVDDRVSALRDDLGAALDNHSGSEEGSAGTHGYQRPRKRRKPQGSDDDP